MMRERPILFSGPMVRAILAGTKTQTRRVIFKDDPHNHMPWWCRDHWQDGDELLRCPYGGVGDQLWVRESWAPRVVDGAELHYGPALYKADYADAELFPTGRWRPSIHMFRWASRIDLAIEAVRVERLQDISLDDMRAEGVQPNNEASLLWRETLATNFRAAWDAINGQRAAWASNPWLWVITFGFG